MCTVTVIPLTDRLGRAVGFRLATNRDEARARPAAEPPAERDLDGRAALWPVDKHAGGTWIGATDRALALTLLNVNPGPASGLPSPPGVRSRGEIVPSLLDAEGAEEAVRRLEAMNLARYRPFRVVAVDGERMIDARWDQHRLIETVRPLEPACFVSSGLGDHLVEPRLMLFDSLMRSRTPSTLTQDTFHRHTWAGHEHISVMMSREDARTVSTTVVEVRFGEPRASVRMTYRDDEGQSEASLSDAEEGAAHARC